MKKNRIKYLLITLSLAIGVSSAQPAESSRVDGAAIALLDRMSMLIGDLESCSFNLRLEQDTEDPEYGMITRHSSHTVYLKGPDKMHVNSNRHNGRRSLWYDGNKLWYYSFRENNYSGLSIQGDLISVFDSLHFKYGVDVPAADIFYPAFTDDILEAFDEVKLVGYSEIDGVECFHILAHGKSKMLQIWLENDAFFLPVKYVITSLENDDVRHYEATFEDWSINPQLPDSMFIFNPPAGSNRIMMISKE